MSFKVTLCGLKANILEASSIMTNLI